MSHLSYFSKLVDSGKLGSRVFYFEVFEDILQTANFLRLTLCKIYPAVISPPLRRDSNASMDPKHISVPHVPSSNRVIKPGWMVSRDLPDMAAFKKTKPDNQRSENAQTAMTYGISVTLNKFMVALGLFIYFTFWFVIDNYIQSGSFES